MSPLVEDGGFVRDSVTGALAISGVSKLGGGRLETIGTSRSAGRVASNAITGPVDHADMWPSKLAAMLGLEEVQSATSGATLSWDEAGNDSSGGGWCSIYHRFQRPTPGKGQFGVGGIGDWSQPNRVVTLGDFINDPARINLGVNEDSSRNTASAGSTRTDARAQIIGQHTMRTLISLACASRMWAPNHTAGGQLVYSGTASSQVNVTYNSGARVHQYGGAKSGPGGYRTMPSGAIVTIPLPADYPGSAVAPLAILFSADNATTAGSVVSSGTGVPTKTLSLVGANVAEPTYWTDNSRSVAGTPRTNPLLMRFTGSDLAAGAQSIVLTITGLTGNPARFQGAWVESDTPPDVLCLETARCNPMGVLFPQNVASDIVTWNGWLQSVIAEFGSHVQYVPLTIFSTAGDVADHTLDNYYTDTMHFTDIGNAEIALAAYNVLTGEAVTTELRKRVRRARKQPGDFRCSLALSADQAITDSVATAIAWDQELHDHRSMRDDAAPWNTRVVCISEGLYMAQLEISMSSPNVTGIRTASFKITRADGSTRTYQAPVPGYFNSNGVFLPGGVCTAYFDMFVNDYVETIIFHNAGVSTSVKAGSTLDVVKLRAI